MSKEKHQKERKKNNVTENKELLEKEIQRLSAIEFAASELYDKYLIGLSTAFLGGTISIVSYLSPSSPPKSAQKIYDFLLLKVSMGLFLGTVLLLILALLTIHQAIKKEVVINEKMYEEGNYSAEKDCNWVNTFNEILRPVTFIMFTVGTLLLAIFVYQNF